MLCREAYWSTACFLLLFAMIVTPTSFTQTYAATAGTGQPLPVGSWWSVTGIYHRTATGSRSDWGTWTRDGTYTNRFSVVRRDADKIVISWYASGSWSRTATGVFDVGDWQNTYSFKVDYTIDLATLKVTAVSDKSFNDEIGHPAWFLINPASLSAGGTVLLGWWAPSSDAKSEELTDVPWSVARQTVSIKGISVGAWSLTYTGEHFGWWRSGDVHSKGQQTGTDLFDATYGIYLGFSASGSFSFTRSGGGWTETFSGTDKITDTNLTFSVPVTVNAEPTDVTVIVDGVTYTGNQFPKVFTWDVGSTHTLQVNEMISGGPGLRYVFVQWSDGSKDKSRTVTILKSVNYTIIYKTQYELKIISDLGNPQGSGWYDAGSTATFSVTSPITTPDFMGSLGGKYVFTRWSGDSSETKASASIKMDRPKTVKAEWTTDYTQPYMIIGGIAAVIIIALVGAVAMRRRKRPPAVPSAPYAPPPPPPPTPTAPPPSVEAPAFAPVLTMKYCVHCGAQMPVESIYCRKCGERQ